MKCFSFSWFSSDQADLFRITINESVLDVHCSIICLQPLIRSSEVIRCQQMFSVNNFRSNWDRDTKWMAICLSHQDAPTDVWHDHWPTEAKSCRWPGANSSIDCLKSSSRYTIRCALTSQTQYSYLPISCIYLHEMWSYIWKTFSLKMSAFSFNDHWNLKHWH